MKVRPLYKFYNLAIKVNETLYPHIKLRKAHIWTKLNIRAGTKCSESRLKWKFSNFPQPLLLLLSEYRVMSKWFGAHYNQDVRFSSAV